MRGSGMLDSRDADGVRPSLGAQQAIDVVWVNSRISLDRKKGNSKSDPVEKGQSSKDRSRSKVEEWHGGDEKKPASVLRTSH